MIAVIAAALAVMVVIVWLTPVAFTALDAGALWTNICYWTTESAGKIGTAIIVLITGLVYTRRLQSNRDIAKSLARTTVLLFLIIGAFAFVNENVTKKITKTIRPSLEYVSKNADGAFSLEKLYALPKEERTNYILRTLREHHHSFYGIDELVLMHWADESGYSFPSGHSFNSFLLACVLSFSMYYSRSNRVKPLFVLPLIWAVVVCVSRVALGAHSALDVTFGGVLGTIVGVIFITWDDMRNRVLHRKLDV